MTALMPSALQRVEGELERIGLLLEHDAELPSVTLLATGEPIRGSWWGHPLGHAIYDLLHELGERSFKLHAKLVNGKVTYVHARLWPAFLALAQDRRPTRVRGLGPLATELLERAQAGTALRLDELKRQGVSSSKELTVAARELEARALVFSDSVHTDSGAHARIIQGWSGWCADHGVTVPVLELPDARAQLLAAAAELARTAPRPVKLAL